MFSFPKVYLLVLRMEMDFFPSIVTFSSTQLHFSLSKEEQQCSLARDTVGFFFPPLKYLYECEAQ